MHLKVLKSNKKEVFFLLLLPLIIFFVVYFSYNKILLYSDPDAFYSSTQIDDLVLQEEISNPYSNLLIGRLLNFLPDAYVKDGRKIRRGANDLRVTFSPNHPVFNIPTGKKQCIDYNIIADVKNFTLSVGQGVIYDKEHLAEIGTLVGDNYEIVTELNYEVYASLKWSATVILLLLSFLGTWAIFITIETVIKKILHCFKGTPKEPPVSPYKSMNTKKIIKELSQKYPGKRIIKLPEDNPTEIICEIDPATNHPDKGVAVAVIDKSEPHYHKAATEIYKIIKGELTVSVNNQEYKLKEGNTLTVKPGEIHHAVGNETWVEVYSEPGWTQEDHILTN